MSLQKKWDEHMKQLESARGLLEDLAQYLPASGSGRKLRQGISRLWDKIGDNTSQIDDIIITKTQPIPISFPFQDKEFAALWKLYKDYLQEQHSLSMGSRMENARLKLLVDMYGSDRELITRSINYYMAFGSPGVFNVNFEKIDFDPKTNNNEKRPKVFLSAE